MNRLFYFFILFSLILFFFPSLISSQDYFAPNMLIPKKVYQDDTYDVPRLNRVKSNGLFGWRVAHSCAVGHPGITGLTRRV